MYFGHKLVITQEWGVIMEISVGVHEDLSLVQAVRELALEEFIGPCKPQYASKEKFVWLREMDSMLWLDTGDAEAADEVWSPELEGLTTNNSLVNQVVQTGAMDGLVVYASRKIRQARPDIAINDLVIELAFLINAKIALSLVQKFGARVSVELHPALASDIARSMAFARRYYEINPEYFFIKAPISPAGFVIARLLSQEGIGVNFTLGFSARQNYLATRFSKPRFVNVFLGRLNQMVEENGLGSPENVGEKATLASDEMVKNFRSSMLEISTQQIAASMRSGRQVATLAGVDVLTMPPKIAQEYLDLQIDRNDLIQHNWRDLEVNLNYERAIEADSIAQLWNIGPQFVFFVEDAVRHADQVETGDDLVELSHKHHVALFHDWSSEDRQKIRQKGKIPNVADWPGAPIDDLMTIAAIESFAKDQAELDSRIESLIAFE
jgi:transaldolase